jgi:FkbM family methyltransferase
VELAPMISKKLSCATRVLRALRNNFPDRKPELWRRLPSALWKQLRLRVAPVAGEVTCPIYGGLRMAVDPRDPIGRAIYLYGCYDYPVTRLIEALIAPGMVFFDVGANAGFFSLVASTKCEQVYAFEPLPSNLGRIKCNIEINGLKNVSVIEGAVGDCEGSATLYVPQGDNSGLASLNQMADAQKIEVRVLTLDAFVRDKGLVRADVMKIDIEGAETMAFEGARELLSLADAPDVIFEAHPGSEAANWLAARGYTIYEFTLQREWEARNLFASKRALRSHVARQVRRIENAK